MNAVEVRFTETERERLAQFYERTLCEAAVVGRVRVAFDGLNATLGGPVATLERHVCDVKTHPMLSALGASDIDFKLQRYGGQRADSAKAKQIRVETGFDSLSVRRVRDVISMNLLSSSSSSSSSSSCSAPSFQSSRAGSTSMDADNSMARAAGGDALATHAPIHDAGVHLSPEEWHDTLARADRGEDNDDDDVLLLDARNWYERRIGGFCAPRVESLDVKLRSFGELPEWMRNASQALVSTGSASTIEAHRDTNTTSRRRKKKILMYCTGGVRCERASSYLKKLLIDERRRALERGIEDVNEVEVHQLRGGIQRYLEAYPDGGYFRGVNFVFDDRLAVGPSSRAQLPQNATDEMGTIFGRCLLCSAAAEDYSPRLRCSHCRMLLLICQDCIGKRGENGCAAVDARCELCVMKSRGETRADDVASTFEATVV